MKTKLFFTGVLIIVALFLFQSCATILAGSKGKIEVKQGQPANAQIYLNGNLEGNAPKTISVSKNSVKKDETKIEIKSEGYETATITLYRRTMIGHVILDVLLTGCVGLAVDFVTAAIYHPLPKEISYSLNASNKSSTNNSTKTTNSQSSGSTASFSIGDNVSFKNEKGEYHDGKIIGINQTSALVQYKTTTGEILQVEVELGKLFRLQ